MFNTSSNSHIKQKQEDMHKQLKYRCIKTNMSIKDNKKGEMNYLASVVRVQRLTQIIIPQYYQASVVTNQQLDKHNQHHSHHLN